MGCVVGKSSGHWSLLQEEKVWVSIGSQLRLVVGRGLNAGSNAGEGRTNKDVKPIVTSRIAPKPHLATKPLRPKTRPSTSSKQAETVHENGPQFISQADSGQVLQGPSGPPPRQQLFQKSACDSSTAHQTQAEVLNSFLQSFKFIEGIASQTETQAWIPSEQVENALIGLPWTGTILALRTPHLSICGRPIASFNQCKATCVRGG